MNDVMGRWGAPLALGDGGKAESENAGKAERGFLIFIYNYWRRQAKVGSMPLLKMDPNERPKLFSRIGTRAIYRCTGFLIPVTVKAVKLEGAFSATLEAVNGIILTSRKLAPLRQSLFCVGSAWERLGVAPEEWSFAFPGCVWSVKFSEARCEAVVRLVQDNAGLDPGVLYKMAMAIDRYPSDLGIPDNVEVLLEKARERRKRGSTMDGPGHS